MNDFAEDATIISRDGTLRGRATGGRRPCFDGCPGVKFAVRWEGGRLTWVCSADVVRNGDGHQLRPLAAKGAT